MFHLVRDFSGHSSIIDDDQVFSSKQYQYISIGYTTEEGLRIGESIPPEPCICCGEIFGTDFVEPVGSILRETNTCFHCNHFKEKIALVKAYPEKYIVVNNVGYSILPDTKDYFKGHGGRAFYIAWLNSPRPLVVTHNLWCWGDIPIHLRHELPDTAKFITPMEYYEYIKNSPHA